MTDVQVSDVRVRYGDVAALAGVNLDVAAGQIMAVLGASGCGKTTLLRVVAGFERPSAGHVRIGGRTVVGPRRFIEPERRGVGIVPQDGALFPHLDVAGNVGFGLPKRAPGRRERIAAVLELVGLAALARRHPHELSGGQQQRVALARALAPRPQLVLLDEPFSALDAGLRASVRREVRDALRQEGATALLVTHDQDEALSTADAVAVMSEGRILEQGSPQDVYHRPRTLQTARFVGAAVELDAVACGQGAETGLGWLPASPTGGVRPGDAVVALLRPEQFHLLPVPSAGDSLRGQVVDVDYHGHDALARLEVLGPTGGRVRVVSRTDASVRPGQPVGVAVAGEAMLYPADTHPPEPPLPSPAVPSATEREPAGC